MGVPYKLEPRPYQRAIVEKLSGEEALALYLEQGLGKTKVSIDQAMWRFLYDSCDGLVVMSKLLAVENWAKEEIGKHCNVPFEAYLYTQAGRKRVPKVWKPTDKLRVFLINDGQMRTKHGEAAVQNFLQNHRCGFIIDESTLIKNPTAKLTKAVMKLQPLSAYRRVLSGTPDPQGPADYFSQYRFLSPSILRTTSFTAFKNQFCKQRSIFINGREIRTPTGEFNHGMKEVFETIVAPYTVRLRKDEVLKELPPKQYQRIVFSLPTDVQREYNRLAEEFYTELVVNRAPEEKAQVTATVAIARITRLHQLACGHIVGDDGKLSRIENGRFGVLQSLLEERPKGTKTIVWCHYRENIDELMERLPEGSSVKIYGGISAEERTAALEAFQRGEASVLLANPAAAGWSLTLTCADTSIYYSNSFNFEHRAQSEDRIHRIGQTAQKVMYYDIVAEGTVDERIMDVLKNKQSFSETVMRGLNEWLKQVL